jgi:hypothetical protein
MLHNIRLQRLANVNHANLLVQIVSYKKISFVNTVPLILITTVKGFIVQAIFKRLHFLCNLRMDPIS